jgi:hypothetical protein
LDLGTKFPKTWDEPPGTALNERCSAGVGNATGWTNGEKLLHVLMMLGHAGTNSKQRCGEKKLLVKLNSSSNAA